MPNRDTGHKALMPCVNSASDGARHSQRVSGAVVSWARYQSVLVCVPKCPDFARPVECPGAKCPIFAEFRAEFRAKVAHLSIHTVTLRAPPHAFSARIPNAYSFRARNFAPSHMHLYGKLYCRVLPIRQFSDLYPSNLAIVQMMHTVQNG